MKMKTFLAALLLMLPVAAWGTDGDKIASEGAVDVTKGSFYSHTFILCDGVLGSDAACDEFDLNDSDAGMPDWFIFSRDAVDSDCTGDVTIAINGQTASAGTEHIFATLNDTNTSLRVEGPRKRYVDADISNVAGCEDGGTDSGITVNMTLYFVKR